MLHNKIVVAITQGDINGVSYEVIMKTLSDPRIYDMCIPIVYGSPKVAAYHRKAIKLENIAFHHIQSAEMAVSKKANIINCVDDEIRVELGKSTDMAGEAAVASLHSAVADMKSGMVDVLVTGPINKHSVQSERFNFAGHTEYLEDAFGTDEQSLMLLVADAFRVGLVTTHVPLSQVPDLITRERVIRKVRIMNESLKRDFNIRKPKIAVLGLNPHAGDDGLLGKEETEQIMPAIKTLFEEENIMAFGPYAADGFFGAGDYQKFDAVMAMYHDQGLTPFKTLNFYNGVNVTAGLSVIRTSPGHGTAYNLAGTGKASPDSFREALYLSLDIFRNRKLFDEVNENPLPSYNINELDEHPEG